MDLQVEDPPELLRERDGVDVIMADSDRRAITCSNVILTFCMFSAHFKNLWPSAHLEIR